MDQQLSQEALKEAFLVTNSQTEEGRNRVSQLFEKEARVVVYSKVSPVPEVIPVSFTTVEEYVDTLCSIVSEKIIREGSSLPLYIIKELIDNLIFAQFSDVVISISDEGRQLRISDHGPGFEDKDLCLKQGFSTATSFHRRFIRATGSGFSILDHYAKENGATLSLEDNIGGGAVVTLTSPSKERVKEDKAASPKDIDHKINYTLEQIAAVLGKRQRDVLTIAAMYDELGPTVITEVAGLALATAHRDLALLTKYGLLEVTPDRKRRITQLGHDFINGSY